MVGFARPVIKDGFLTIKGFRRVKDLFSVDELIGIIKDFLGFYDYGKVDQKLVVRFRPSLYNILPRIFLVIDVILIVGTFVGGFFVHVFWYILVIFLLYEYLLSGFEKFLLKKVKLTEQQEVAGFYLQESKTVQVYTNVPLFNTVNRDKKTELTWILLHELDHFLWSFEGREHDYEVSWEQREGEIRAMHRATEFMLSKNPV